VWSGLDGVGGDDGLAGVVGGFDLLQFDGGKTWHSAIVSELSPGHFRAKFTAPAGAKVTLRTRVSGTAATSVTETIWDAYRVANGGHG
jgi:hypothetical protein